MGNYGEISQRCCCKNKEFIDKLKGVVNILKLMSH